MVGTEAGRGRCRGLGGTRRRAGYHYLVPTRTEITAKLTELIKFGFVGGMAYIVDTGLFNLLRFGPGELLGDKPLTAKIVSAAIATLFAWLGNRYWTFSTKRNSNSIRELLQFIIVNVGGMGVALLCLWFSHYVLGLTSPLADNISANVIGVGLGMIFRYWLYSTWVFTGDSAAAPPQPALPEASPLADPESREVRSGTR